ncbi:MAG: DUF1003 domain-containing protein [Symbiobacteriia bacterium]
MSGTAAQDKLDNVREEYESTVVKHLNEEFYKRLRLGDKVADRVAKFGGSWTFIGIATGFLVLWIAGNVFTGAKAVDPYPFILLNLVLSSLAAIQAPVIMMAQNRSEERSHVEAEIDYAINIKAEQEVDDMQQDLHEIKADLAKTREENAELRHLLEELLERIPERA